MNNRAQQAYEAFHDLRNKGFALKQNLTDLRKEHEEENNNAQHEFVNSIINQSQTVTNVILQQLTKIYTYELLFSNIYKLSTDIFEISDLVVKINKLLKHAINDRSLKIEVLIHPLTILNVGLDFKLLLYILNILIDQQYDCGAKFLRLEQSNNNQVIPDHQHLKITLTSYNSIDRLTKQDSNIILNCIMSQLSNKHNLYNCIQVGENNIEYQIQSNVKSELYQGEMKTQMIEEDQDIEEHQNRFKTSDQITKHESDWDDQLFRGMSHYQSETHESKVLMASKSGKFQLTGSVNLDGVSKKISLDLRKSEKLSTNRQNLSIGLSSSKKISINKSITNKSLVKSIPELLLDNEESEFAISQKDLSKMQDNSESVKLIIPDAIQINIDDEQSILSMNKRLFSKMKVDIRLVKTGNELLMEISKIIKDKHKGMIHIISDYKLEYELGDEVIMRVRKFILDKQDKELNISLAHDETCILREWALSSTEDMSVHEKFRLMDVKLFQKPLKKAMVEEIVNSNQTYWMEKMQGKFTIDQTIQQSIMKESDWLVEVELSKKKESEELANFGEINKSIETKLLNDNEEIKEGKNNLISINFFSKNLNNLVKVESNSINEYKAIGMNEEIIFFEENDEKIEELNLKEDNKKESKIKEIQRQSQVNIDPFSIPTEYQDPNKIKIPKRISTLVNDQQDNNNQDVILQNDNQISDNNVIQIIINKDTNQQNQNQKLFDQFKLDLIQLESSDELITKLSKISKDKNKSKVIIITDYQLNNEYGDNLVNRVKNLNLNKQDEKLKINFESIKLYQIACLSTSDKSIEHKFKNLDVKLYKNPLNQNNLLEIHNNIKNSN